MAVFILGGIVLTVVAPLPLSYNAFALLEKILDLFLQD